MANFIYKMNPAITQKSTGNIFMKLDKKLDGSLEVMHDLFFLSILKKMVAMATNRLKTWQT
jgi:hypothetical protein